jgi:hypothetical protein
MRKILSAVLLIFFLTGCAPKVPDGLKAVIEKSSPNAQHLEAKQGSMGMGNFYDMWCVAYKPDPSLDLVIVEIRHNNTWIMPNFSWARETSFSGIKQEGGWCRRLN